MVDDITRNYHRGNRQSKAAYDQIEGDLSRQRAIVFKHVDQQRRHGSTSEEAEDALGMKHQTVSARFSDLKKDGSIVPLYDSKGEEVKRKTRSGCRAGVFITQRWNSN